jgi:hypothetical protein
MIDVEHDEEAVEVEAGDQERRREKLDRQVDKERGVDRGERLRDRVAPDPRARHREHEEREGPGEQGRSPKNRSASSR